jgi:hypothetical protein
MKIPIILYGEEIPSSEQISIVPRSLCFTHKFQDAVGAKHSGDHAD